MTSTDLDSDSEAASVSAKRNRSIGAGIGYPQGLVFIFVTSFKTKTLFCTESILVGKTRNIQKFNNASGSFHAFEGFPYMLH